MLAPSAETIARTPLSPLAAPSLEISLSGSRLRHNREISISSIASGSTVTSVSTVSTTQSERRYDTTFIVDLDDGQDDERPLLLSDDARRRPILSTARSFRSIAKSLLHLPSSQGGPESRHILWTKPGPLDLSKVERLVKKHQGTVDSFTMTPGTFAPYNGLSETVKKLGVLVSDVQEIVLLSQFYTLVRGSSPSPSPIFADFRAGGSPVSYSVPREV